MCVFLNGTVLLPSAKPSPTSYRARSATPEHRSGRLDTVVPSSGLNLFIVEQKRQKLNSTRMPSFKQADRAPTHYISGRNTSVGGNTFDQPVLPPQNASKANQVGGRRGQQELLRRVETVFCSFFAKMVFPVCVCVCVCVRARARVCIY